MLRNILKRVYRRSEIIIAPHSSPELSAYLNKTDAWRLKNSARRWPSSATLFEKQITFPDAYWFLHSMHEIFVEEVYKFQSPLKDPVIIDCGANIGLSILYFKKLFPGGKVIAFEPDQDIFKCMQNNIAQFGFENIELINKGVWNEETTLSFLAEGTLGGRVVDQQTTEASYIVSIPTVRLKDYLRQPVDFLKIDIEGAEYEVMKDCADTLNNVRLLFIEYHSTASEPQKLNEILEIVSRAGFRYYIREAAHTMKYPYIDKNVNWFDLQLNIFCYRN